MLNKWEDTLTKGFTRLIDVPGGADSDGFHHSMVRLAVAIQIATVVLITIGLVLRYAFGGTSLLDAVVLALNGLLALCLVLFSRRGKYEITNFVMLIAGTLAVFGLAIYDAPYHQEAFYYLIMILLLFGLTIRPASAVILFLLHVSGMVALALLVPGYSLRSFVLGPLTFYVVGAPLLMLLLYVLSTAIRHEISRIQTDVTHYRMIFSQAYDAILLLGLDGTILDANQSAARLHGYTHDQLLTLSVYDLQPPERRGKPATPNYRFETVGLKADGTQFPLEVTQVPVQFQGRVVRLAIVRDISEQKQARSAIEQYAAELEERNRELDAFTYTVAHDLKNPLNAVHGFAEIIEMVKDREDMVSENLAYMMRSLNVMNNIINDLLMLSRLRNADEMIAVVDMNLAAYAAIERTQPQIEERGVMITIEGDLPPASGYMPWIETVFVNLIGNAVKYIGHDNPDPRIRIRAADHNGSLRYEVIDNGIGVDPARAESLFEMFERGHRAEAEGTGLGLSIVKRIITRLKGQAGAEPNPVKGSIFWFTLPPAQ